MDFKKRNREKTGSLDIIFTGRIPQEDLAKWMNLWVS